MLNKCIAFALLMGTLSFLGGFACSEAKKESRTEGKVSKSDKEDDDEFEGGKESSKVTGASLTKDNAVIDCSITPQASGDLSSNCEAMIDEDGDGVGDTKPTKVAKGYTLEWEEPTTNGLGLTSDLNNLSCSETTFDQECTFNPPSSTKKIKFGFALASDDETTSIDAEILQPAIERVYANSNSVDSWLWNYYVDQSTTTSDCNKTTSTRCYHAGERRKAVLTGISSCSGLTASDALSVFNWRCEVVSGTATFFTNGFNEGKGLTNLLDATAFKKNSLTISGASIPLSSAYATWWTNTVSTLPAGPDLSSSYAIYTISSDTNAGVLHINADGVGIVNLNTKKLTFTGGANNCNLTDGTRTAPNGLCFLTISSQAFLWLEARLEYTTAAYLINLCASKFSRLHRVHATSLGGAAVIRLQDSSKNLITGTRMVNGNFGLSMMGGSQNVIDSSSVYKANLGLNLISKDNIILSSIFAHNETIGYYNDDTGNVALNMLVAGNGTGAEIRDNGSYASFHNLLQINGATFDNWSVSATNINVFNLAIFSTDFYALRMVGVATFKGKLKIGTTAGQCSIAGGSNISHDGSNNCITGDAGLTITQGINLSSSFVGKLTSGDSANENHTDLVNGNGYFTGTSITDFFNFSSRFRVWGRDAASITVSEWCNIAASQDCAAWDWGVKSTDSSIRNQNACPSGNDTLSHTWTDASVVTYLKNAVEFVTDGIGNENGLCESGEFCLFSPNIGAYQGHGSIVSSANISGCANIGSGGTLTNIKLYEYTSNGL